MKWENSTPIIVLYMHKSWIQTKLPEFVRDVLRDFCQVSQSLYTQFEKYEQTQHVEFNFYKDLLGDEMNKGQLWRLKDTAHILFRNDPCAAPTGLYLDWCIGYIFHECMKLREDAYQKENYRPWFEQRHNRSDISPEEQLISQELFTVLDQTKESIDREISRIKFILFHCRRLFILYLPQHQNNQLLARFLFAREALVRQVFKSSFSELIDSIYNKNPTKLYELAAQSLERGGWFQDAQAARARIT